MFLSAINLLHSAHDRKTGGLSFLSGARGGGGGGGGGGKRDWREGSEKKTFSSSSKASVAVSPRNTCLWEFSDAMSSWSSLAIAAASYGACMTGATGVTSSGMTEFGSLVVTTCSMGGLSCCNE